MTIDQAALQADAAAGERHARSAVKLLEYAADPQAPAPVRELFMRQAQDMIRRWHEHHLEVQQ